MSLKIKISYTEDVEEQTVLTLLKPLLDRFKVRKTEGTAPYKHLYFIPKNGKKSRN